MSDIASYPRQDNYETTLVSEIAAGDLSMVVSDAPSFALSSGTCYMTIDPGLSTQETVVVTAVSGTTLTITRAAALYEGATSTAYSHSGGAKVVMSNNWNYYNDILTASNSKVDESGDTMTGKLAFSGTTHAGLQLISLTTAQRNALTPVNGDIVYDSDLGQNYQYIAGSWNAVDAGTVFANASTTVAGKVEAATAAEVQTGETTGATGALLFGTPNLISDRVQRGAWIYAADAEASDTYVITLDHTPSALTAGAVFNFKANTINTGAATLNVNSLGATAIKKNDDEDLEDGDIQAGQIVSVCYDGTNFQMVSPTAAQMSVANKDTLTDGSEAGGIHYHSMTSGTVAWGPTGATQTSQITHGLGRTPKYIRATYYVQDAGTVAFVPGGVLTYSSETGLDGIHTTYTSSGPTYSSNIGAAAIVQFGAQDFQFDIRAVGATTFDFYCTAYISTQAINILWEAY